MIVETLKRGEKLLAALAAGCWLLTPGWVETSGAAGAWVPEEAWELFEPGGGAFEGKSGGTGWLWVGAPRRHRVQRQQGGAGGLHGLALVLAADTAPPPATLGHIVAAGGGRVCASLVLRCRRPVRRRLSCRRVQARRTHLLSEQRRTAYRASHRSWSSRCSQSKQDPAPLMIKLLLSHAHG